MDELISEYYSLAKAYLIMLTEYSENQPNVQIPANSTFKSEENYIRFRTESLKELVKVIQNITEQLNKYNKFKTLNPKIERMAIMNDLTQGKFYDYAIGYYNFRDIEPELYELVDNHFTKFFELSKKVESAEKQRKNK